MFYKKPSFHTYPEHATQHGHEHTHGSIDPGILSTSRGIWAVKWSFLGLGIRVIHPEHLAYNMTVVRNHAA